MDHHRIYLSGPICGLTFAECTEWRGLVKHRLEDFAEILDPMRDVTADTFDTVITTDGGSQSTADPVMNTDRGIITRDYFDTVTSTLLIVNLLGAKKASIGTVAEIAWAYQARIPIIVIMEDTGNVHEHPFVTELASFRVDNIQRAISVAKSMIGVPNPEVWQGQIPTTHSNTVHG